MTKSSFGTLPLALTLCFGVFWSACSDCDNSIEVNNPPFPCLDQLGLRSFGDTTDGSNGCNNILVLRGTNTCDEALIFPGDFDELIFQPGDEIEISLSPTDFTVEGPSRRNHEIPVTMGNETERYLFSVN